MITGQRIPYQQQPLVFLDLLLKKIDGEKVCVVLPTIRNVRKLASNLYKTIDIYSIKEFTEYATQSKGVHIPKQLRPFFLKQAALSLSNDDKLTVFRKENTTFFENLLSFIQVAKNIFSFYRELSAEMVSVDDLFKAGKYTDYEAQITVLQRLWQNYLDIIKKHGFYDEWENYRNPLLNNDFVSRYDKFIFLIGGYLTKYELTQLKKLSENKNVELLFNFVGEPSNHHKIYERYFNFEFEKDYEYFTTNENTDIYECSNMISQLELITSLAFEYNHKGTPFENMAVIIPDESIKSYFLRLDKYNLFDITSNEDIESFEFFALLKLLSEYSKDYNKHHNSIIDISYIMKILSQPMLKNKEELYNLYEEYNNLLLSGYKIHEDINILITKPFFKDTALFFFQHKKNMLLKDICKNITNFLKNLEIDNEKENASLKTILYKLEELEYIYSFVNDEVDFNEGLHIIINELAELRIQTPKGKISVTGILESRNLNYDIVFIPSMNDDIFPPKSKKDMFLNTEIRRNLELPTYSDRENLMKNYLLQIMAQSKKSILLYSSNINTRNKSRFVEEILINSNIAEKKYSPTEINLIQSNINYIKYSDEIIINKNNEIMKYLSSNVFYPSSINIFINCPIKYYFTYIKKLKITKDISTKINYVDIGDAIHKGLEYIFKRNIDPNSIDFINEFRRIFRKELSKFDSYNNSTVEKIKADLIEDNIELIQKREIKRKNEGYYPKYIEHELSNDFYNYKLKGRIDRIDYNNNNNSYDIIDFKYRNIDEFKNKEFKEESVNDIQMFCYTMLVVEKMKIKPDNIYYFDVKNNIDYKNAFNMDLYKDYRDFLKKKLDQLHNINEPFTQTQKISKCRTCDYKDICGR